MVEDGAHERLLKRARWRLGLTSLFLFVAGLALLVVRALGSVGGVVAIIGLIGLVLVRATL
jgi:hypothetical protein